MTSETSTKTAKPAPSAKPVKTTKAVAAPKKTLTPRKAAKPAQPALAKPLTSEQIFEMFRLVKGATSVELKLSVPVGVGRATVKSIGLDPVEAQPRQAFFFDTPDLALNKAGVVVRARRIQGGDGDTVIFALSGQYAVDAGSAVTVAAPAAFPASQPSGADGNAILLGQNAKVIGSLHPAVDIAREFRKVYDLTAGWRFTRRDVNSMIESLPQEWLVAR